MHKPARESDCSGQRGPAVPVHIATGLFKIGRRVDLPGDSDRSTLNLVVEGTAHFTFGGRSVVAEPNTLLLFPPSLPRSIASKDFARIYAVRYRSAETPAEEVLVLDGRDDFLVRRCIEDLHLLWKKEGTSPTADFLVGALVSRVQHLSSGHKARAALPRPVNLALAAMERPGRRLLSLDEMADAACITKGHLNLLFRRHLGVTPMAHQRLARLERARVELLDRKLAVKEIAARAGFGDPNHFARLFRHQFGVAPRAYRARFGA